MRLLAVASEHRTAKFDLTLLMEERDETIAATFEYDAELFEAASIERRRDTS